MKINKFLSNTDTLEILTSILQLDGPALKQMGTEQPIGQLVIPFNRVYQYTPEPSQGNPWMRYVCDRYPELNTLIHQVLNATVQAPSPVPESYHGWHLTITKYPQPLHLKLFQSLHADQLVIALIDDYLMAIHQGLIHAEQFCLTRQQTVVHLIKQATGWSNQAIANALFCSSETIKKHQRDIRLKQDHSLQQQQQPVYIGVPAGFAAAAWFA